MAYIWMTTAGSAKLHLGSYEQAAAWFWRAIEANRNNPPAYLNLASEVDQKTAIDAFITAIATALAYDDKLSLKDIDDSAKRIRRKIAARARSSMFPGDNQIWDGPPFGIVDVDGIRLRFRAVGAPPAEDFKLTKNLITKTRKNVRMDWVRRMPAKRLAEPLIAIRDPTTDTAVVVDGSHRMVRLWLDGARTARAYILSPQTYAPFLFKTFAEFKACCFRGETITKARLRVIFTPQKPAEKSE